MVSPVEASQEPTEEEEPATAATATLTFEDEPVEGVEVRIETAEGEEIETVETDEDGTFLVELPGPGVYRSILNPDTLPEGVTLRNEDRATLEFTIRTAGRPRTLLYPLGEGTRDVESRLDRGLQLAVEGVKFGLIIAMAAVGLSLIFGTTGLVNFAHGEIVTFGALIAYFFNVTIGMALIPAAILSMIVTGIAGGLLDRGLWRPLRARGTGLIAMLVITIGMSLLLRHLFLYQFGGRTRPFDDYQVQRAWNLGPVDLTPRDAFSIVLSLVVLIGIGLALARTRAGKAMRAVADNPDLASSSGIDVERVVLLVWVTGSALAALGGVLLGLTEQVSFQMGFLLLLLMFAGVTLGGLGTAYGALVGSFVVGLFVQLSTLYLAPELKNVGALLILILILLVRPQGILGSAERVG